MDALIGHATELRAGFFLAGILIFGITGIAFPFRPLQKKRDRFRWANNLSLTLLNTVISTVFVPFSLVALASKTSHDSLEVVLQVILLDCIIYVQHVTFHRVDILWRLHQVHHSDTEFDSTTALRFHTLEIYISFFIKALAVGLFGINATAVVIFEIILNFSAMFNHGNFSLPQSLEKMNLLFVTPDMHRIHHSLDRSERDSNYGFFLSIWDRIFKTYRSISERDLRFGKLGTTFFRSLNDQSVGRLLAQPFISPRSAQGRDVFIPREQIKKSG